MTAILGIIGVRILHVIPTLFLVTVMVFTLLRVIPGDPLLSVLPPDATEAQRDLVAKQMGLDKPLPLQYLKWLGNVVRGNFGYSITFRHSVSDLVISGFRNTLILALVSAVIVLVLGVTIGGLSALRGSHWSGSLLTGFGIVGASVPSYWTAMLLIIAFAIEFSVLPASGMRTIGNHSFGDLVRHMILPVIAISLGPIGVMVRVSRSAIMDTLNQEFVTALRAKGLRRTQIARHVLRNASLPIVTIFALQMGHLLSGSVLVETLFGWPGLGTLTYQSISQRDLQTTLGSVLVIATVFIGFNLAADVVRAIIDPRLRQPA